MLINVERTGTSLHLWLGPVGLHLFRHKSPYERFRFRPDFSHRWFGDLVQVSDR